MGLRKERLIKHRGETKGVKPTRPVAQWCF